MRPEKQLLLDEIKQQIDGSAVMILAKYQQMNPNLSAAFRTSLGSAGGAFEIVRKRILLKAMQAAGFAIDADLLQGHIGVIFAGKDPIQVTKVLYQFTKENEDILEVLGARFEGKFCSAEDVKQISELPSQDEMRAQFLGLLEAPLAQTLAVMEALLTSVPYCLENKSSSNL
jgi:large subunit ribosomal protein L10